MPPINIIRPKEIVLTYNHIFKTVRGNASVTVEQNCNSYSAINTGATLATVNGVPINAGVPGTNNGESISFNGNKGEIYKGRIDVNFPVTAGGEVILIQKIYLPDNPLDI